MLLIHIHQYSRRQVSAKGAKGAKAQGRWVDGSWFESSTMGFWRILNTYSKMYHGKYMSNIPCKIPWGTFSTHGFRYSMYFPCTSTHTALGTKMKQVFGCNWIHVLKIRFKNQVVQAMSMRVFFPSAAGALPKENKRRAGSMRVNGCWYMFVYPCFGVSQFHPRFRIYQEWCSDTGFHFYQFRDDIGESFWVPRSLVCQFVAHLWHGFGMFWSHLWLLTWFIHRNVQSCSNL